ncbi:MAG: hypothetical protein UU88_C0009G0017 [Parcubacteria group bacterium GW2011_GWC1_42_11]|uniref:Uncharacterized protein n=1 Tax=Candidatus Nomurabacteria bacterium GW2011_GWC2_42_20 TaxID=1618756 RepID=A0A0G1BN86_9BACT|nr:MAG: hypothetical protein UU88_C0009G0017 [Parcubacteria group bacterium GW2011_GWC1_42_11]KKS47736.1 MAG: hypothetical protein UV12_C0005G0011 [Candidatus Nomurabacteria bacterium GW2011_GWC2_42_20]KKT08627.1 MAG: hypothetical protein UV86_C0017G0001 [Candidatus Nomurabacteria bacterium GW2011_GWB1_43_20]
MVVFGFCFIGSAKAAERAGLPGGYTLEQSHALCESKLKTGGYQECMANKRGLFSVTQDGTPYENFVWSPHAVTPPHPMDTCMEFYLNNKNDVVWRQCR